MAVKKWLMIVHRWTVLYFIRFLLNIFKGTGKSVHQIRNDAGILKVPATVLAAKIRTGEVSRNTIFLKKTTNKMFFFVIFLVD